MRDAGKLPLEQEFLFFHDERGNKRNWKVVFTVISIVPSYLNNHFLRKIKELIERYLLHYHELSSDG